MSAMTAELFRSEAIQTATGTAPTTRRTAAPTEPRRRPLRRPGHGTGRTSGPASRPAISRPVRGVAAPTLAPGAQTRARSCTVDPAPVRWRLTDRGIAVVLVTGLMIVAAAVAVVGMTALRVTGEHYQPFQQAEVVSTSQS